MARPLRIEYPGAFYHIIQKGNEGQHIFLSDQDRMKFYDYLSVIHRRYKINIHAYCLMNNHYHLILETEKANLSNAMHYLNTSYTIYFNLNRKRTGHLFRGRYKSILVEADEYLHQLSKYIHLNPLRAGLVKDPIDYKHSSLRYFVSSQKAPVWLSMDFVLLIFDNNIVKAKSLYRKFIFDNIGNEADVIRKNMVLGFLFGSQDFIDDIKSRFINGKNDPEIPILKAARYQLSFNDIRTLVDKKIDNAKFFRKICIYLTRRYTALSLKEIASLFNNISDAGISILCRRIENRRITDEKFNRVINEIENLLKVET